MSMQWRTEVVPANPGFSIAAVLFNDEALAASQVIAIPVIAWEVRRGLEYPNNDEHDSKKPELAAFPITPDGRQDYGTWIICPDGKVISPHGYFGTVEQWREWAIEDYKAGRESVVI